MRKIWLCVLLTALLLCGCTAGGDTQTETKTTPDTLFQEIRTEYQALSGVNGTAQVTADYGQRIYDFTLDFTWQREGETVLTVTSPAELSGLTAVVGPEESYLEFQGMSLGTGDLTGEGLTPLEYLPMMMEEITGGYVAECFFETVGETQTLRILCRDPEVKAGEGLEINLWFNCSDHTLLRAELSQDGYLVLQSEFTSFTVRENGDGTQSNEDLGTNQPEQSGT